MTEETTPPPPVVPDPAPPESIHVDQLLEGRSRDALQVIANQAIRALLALGPMAAPERADEARAIVAAVLAPELRSRRLTLHTHDAANIKAAVDSTIKILKGHQLPGCLVIPAPAGVAGEVRLLYYGEGHVVSMVRSMIERGVAASMTGRERPAPPQQGIIVPGGRG